MSELQSFPQVSVHVTKDHAAYILVSYHTQDQLSQYSDWL
jgi:hypothetical protein